MTNNIMALNTVELDNKDFSNAAILLAKAFYDNPSHKYIFSDKETRLKLLQYGLKANLKLNLDKQSKVGKSFALVEDNRPPGIREIKAMGFWNYPEPAAINFISKLRSGWLTMPLKFGQEIFQRLTEVMKAIDEVKQEVLGTNKAWYLNNMIVSEELRGTGVGTQFLRHQLQSVVIPSGFSAILMTQKEINLRFYQKLGFKVVHKSIIGTGINSFTNWCLLLTTNS